MDRLVLAGYRTTNPCHAVKSSIKGTDDSGVVFLGEGEDRRLQTYLLAHFEATTWKRARWQAMLLFLLGTGVTSKQARTATVDDFVFDDGDPGFNVRTERADVGDLIEKRCVPLESFCVEIVQAWVAARRRYLDSPDCANFTGRRLAFPTEEEGGEFSHTALWYVIADNLRGIGFPGRDIGSQVLRNSYIRRQMIAGVPLEDIKTVCGLKSDETVMKIREMSASRLIAPASRRNSVLG